MTRRPRLQTLAAVLLAVGGALAIFYSGFLPVPPFSDVPVPLVWQLIGVAELLTALGVYLGRAWGRALGVGITAIDLAVIVMRLIAGATSSAPIDSLVTLALSGLLDLFILWVLLRHWQPAPHLTAQPR